MVVTAMTAVVVKVKALVRVVEDLAERLEVEEAKVAEQEMFLEDLVDVVVEISNM